MVVGDRSAQTCRKLWERLPEAYKGLMVYTDFWRAYQKVIPAERHVACGKGTGWTNTVERGHTLVAAFNLTLRQRVGRMVRKTLSFSKSWSRHLLCLRLFVHGYNRYCVKRFGLETT